MNSNTLSENNYEDLTEIAQEILIIAKQQGASSVESVISLSDGFSTTVRLGEVENIEFNQDQSISVSVYFDKCRASASSSDLSRDALVSTVKAACDIAKVTDPDECFGLAEPDLMATHYPNLDLYHPWDIKPKQAIDKAHQLETKALEFDKRIVNSEGAALNTNNFHSVYANSHGFVGKESSSMHSMNVVLVAKDEKGMQRDYDYSLARKSQDLTSIDDLAYLAAQKTIARLSAQKLKTQKVAVIFSSSIAGGLFSSLVSAISGGNLYRKSSFLLDHLGKQIFPDFIQVYERPHLLGGLGSRAFDGDGLLTYDKNFIKDGILNSYVLSTYSARRLGMESSANAGGVFNLSISDNGNDLNQLLKQMDKGVLLTELMGQGVNILTGDYSRGAAGFWVENGKIQYPVDEFTIAANLKDMFKNIIGIGNDIDYRKNIRSGSILLSEMTIAGN